MLALRMQRAGRKGLAHYRLIAQEHSLQPTSGKVAAYLGNYNPHTKEAKLDKEKIEKFLSNGAQPSNTVAKILKKEGVKLPKWVTITERAKRPVKNPKEDAATVAEAPAEDTKSEKPTEEIKTEDPVEEKPTEETKVKEASEESVTETPAKEKSAEKKEEKSAEKSDKKSE